MNNEILINGYPWETRAAVIEEGVVQEVFIELARKEGLVGNLYKGEVSRILPGLQAAFVDIGLDRTAFLHVSDILNSNPDHEATEENGKLDENRFPQRNLENISELLQEGQSIVVQVIKDPVGSKGARLTTQLTIPSRYLVFMPGVQHIGVSQRIEDEEERSRLRAVVTELGGNESPGGFIIRTVAEGLDADPIRADIQFLRKLWESIALRIETARPRTLIHEDLPLALRMVRDFMDRGIAMVRIDDSKIYQRVKEFVAQFIPEMADRIVLHQGDRPLFDLYRIEEEIQRALHRRVPLKSGGHLIIDQTEAMTTIDVNTGGYVGTTSSDETIFRTNLEATETIARQLRLRNLGGIIIIDFIDMHNQEHKDTVVQALKRRLEKDRAKTYLCEISTLGLIEMTRKRTRENLLHLLCEKCPTCQGNGYIKSLETLCYTILREIMQVAKQFETDSVLVLASGKIVNQLLEEDFGFVAEIENLLKKSVRIQSATDYAYEQYDVIPL